MKYPAKISPAKTLFSRRFQPPPSSFFIAILLLLGLASRALAVAEVKDPLSRVYKVDSASVFSATIVKFNPDGQVIEAKLATVYKGEGPTGPIRILTKDYPALSDELKAAKDQAAGMTIVLFPSARTVLLHIADHWYGGACGARPGIYILNERKTDHDGTFPGTTATLLTALDELKAGKSTLVDVFPPITLPKPEKIADLASHATAFRIIEISKKAGATFQVKCADGLYSYEFDGKSITARSHSEAKSLDESFPVALDTKRDIPPSDMPKLTEKTLAAVVTSPTDDAQPDTLVVVTPQGLLRYSLASPSAAPENDLRLTGSKLTSYYPEHKNGFTAASIVSIDINNDGRPDLILLTPEGTLTLLNRGFGCYLVNKNIAAPLLEPIASPATTTPANQSKIENQKSKIPLLAATAHTLWRLNPDGALYRYVFPQK